MFDDLQKSYLEARKGQDKFVTGVLSMLISDLKYEKINKQKELEDTDVIAAVQKSIKQKKEAMAEFEKGGRNDLIEKEKKEVEYLSKLLPAMMSDTELKEIVLAVKKELNASAPSDMGKVMKEVMVRVKGKADGGSVKNMVTEALKNG